MHARKPGTDSDPHVLYARPSQGPLVLHFVFGLITIGLVGCSGSPQQCPGNQQACSPAQDRPSHFYTEAPERKNAKLIIFVHGIFGNAARTWGDPEQETFWPAMVKNDSRFAGYDIYLMNYPTPISGKAPNIHETAGHELGQLMSRNVFERYNEIYVIAHSMGGLVTKSLLTRLNRGEDAALLRRVRGVVFLSTPAQGANIASVATWVSSNPQLKNMEPASLNAYISSLEDSWIHLMGDRDESKAEFPKAYCAHETLEMYRVLVVPKEMAASRCDGPLQSMPFDHSGMAEPTAPDADPYLWAMGKILDAGASGVTRGKAAALVQSAFASSLTGNHAAARQAYEEASMLYTNLEDREGQAHVLRGLGDLERKLGRNDQAHAALTEARNLFKAEDNRLGEANVLWGLGKLEAPTKPELARQHFHQAAFLYEQLDMHEWKEQALTHAKNLAP